MKVIGAGLSTTGTLPLRKALTILGFGPVYHLAELLEIPEKWTTNVVFKKNSEFKRTHVGGIHDCDKFSKAHRFASSTSTYDAYAKVQEKLVSKQEAYKQLEHIFKEFTSSLDFPSNLFYKELSDMYPESKVILTVSDSSQVFAKSSAGSFGAFRIYIKSAVHRLASSLHCVIPRPFVVMMKEMVDPPQTQDYTKYWKDESRLAKNYDIYNARVIKFFEGMEHRLLVFNVKDGWEPLCDFLKVPVPNVRFPKELDLNQVKQLLNVLKLVNYSTILLTVSLVYGVVWLFVQQFLWKE